ncbi:hypothetical protein HK101_007184 [Irineochytrium annulatum]|nr:hypothetical protein HK101_007184 [Irineochytrium annulatum]
MDACNGLVVDGRNQVRDYYTVSCKFYISDNQRMFSFTKLALLAVAVTAVVVEAAPARPDHGLAQAHRQSLKQVAADHKAAAEQNKATGRRNVVRRQAPKKQAPVRSGARDPNPHSHKTAPPRHNAAAATTVAAVAATGTVKAATGTVAAVAATGTAKAATGTVAAVAASGTVKASVAAVASGTVKASGAVATGSTGTGTGTGASGNVGGEYGSEYGYYSAGVRGDVKMGAVVGMVAVASLFML